MPIDYKKYPPNWKTEIRPVILKRADNKCEFCGLSNGQWVYRSTSASGNGKIEWHLTLEDAIKSRNQVSRKPKPIKVILTIAHLDHDETNHEVTYDRLRALCQLCHLRYDAKEKYRRKTNKLFTKETL